MLFNYQKEILDRKFKTPDDWSWDTSRTYKGAFLEEVQGRSRGIINWAGIALHFSKVAELLEDPEKDGKDVRPIPIWEGQGEPAFDITEKSDAWIHCYHTALIGLAKAAENCENILLDKSQNLVVPKDAVHGPSNPYPKSPARGPFKAPLEENCVPIVKSPEAYYMKILHTHGFNGRQRLESAIALGDWYDFKGNASKAEEMYDWGLDIAQGSLPQGVNEVINIKTGIINNNAEYVSSNVITATTAFARYQARHNQLNTALPIFLSILRARRQLLRPYSRKPDRNQVESGSWTDFYRTFKPMFSAAPPLSIPNDGSEVPVRTSEAICEEAGIMSHIGEIFLASSMPNKSEIPKRSERGSSSQQSEGVESGLSWTRDAVDLAEETLESLTSTEADQEARSKCIQCMKSGTENWSLMVKRMLNEARSVQYQPKKSATGSLFWGRSEVSDNTEGRWEGEAEVAEKRLMKARRVAVKEDERELPYWKQMLLKGQNPASLRSFIG